MESMEEVLLWLNGHLGEVFTVSIANTNDLGRTLLMAKGELRHHGATRETPTVHALDLAGNYSIGDVSLDLDEWPSQIPDYYVTDPCEEVGILLAEGIMLRLTRPTLTLPDGEGV